MKKMLAAFLVLPVLLMGCSKQEDSSEESIASAENTVQIDESTIHVIHWVAQPYEEFLVELFAPITKEGKDEEDSKFKYLHIDDRFEDESLQSAIADLNLTYPLSSDERMIEYTLATFEIFIEKGYADPNMIPSSITHYSDGIWCIRWKLDDYDTQGAPGMFQEFYEIYVSELDGHVLDCICIDPAHEFDD